MLQVRQDGRAFAVNRDITNLFLTLARDTSISLEDDKSWPPLLKSFAAAHGLTGAHFVPASVALAQFTVDTNAREYADFPSAWVGSGMGRLPQAVLLLTLFQLGAVTLKNYFAANRAANRTGHRDRDADKLTDTAERSSHALKAELPSARARRRAEARRRDGTQHG